MNCEIFLTSRFSLQSNSNSFQNLFLPETVSIWWCADFSPSLYLSLLLNNVFCFETSISRDEKKDLKKKEAWGLWRRVCGNRKPASNGLWESELLFSQWAALLALSFRVTLRLCHHWTPLCALSHPLDTPGSWWEWVWFLWMRLQRHF